MRVKACREKANSNGTPASSDVLLTDLGTQGSCHSHCPSATITRLGVLHCAFRGGDKMVPRRVSPRIIYDSSGSTGERSKLQALESKDVILLAPICTSKAPPEKISNATFALIVPTLPEWSFLHPGPPA